MLVDSKQGQKLTGFFKGKVIKHLSFGRCKVWIPGVYPDDWNNFENADKLPTAEQISPLFGGSNRGNGVFSYPNLGSVVICGFYNEDQNMPFFFGSILGGPEAKMQYNEVMANVTEDTQKDGTDAYIHKMKVGRSTIKIWEPGYIEVITKSDEKGTDNCKIVIDGKGNVTVDSTQQIQLNAPNINLMAKDSFQLNANTIKITAASQMDVTTPKLTNMNGVSFNVQAPSINLDASTGSVVIKGNKHTNFYY